MVLIAIGCGRQPPTETEARSEEIGSVSPLSHRPEDVEGLQVPEQLEGVVEPWHGDLSEMVERRMVRVAVARGGFFYYIRDGKQQQLAHELCRHITTNDHLRRAEQELHHQQEGVDQESQHQWPEDFPEYISIDSRTHDRIISALDS